MVDIKRMLQLTKGKLEKDSDEVLKIIPRRKDEIFQKFSGYKPLVPILPKISIGNKNWDIRCIGDDQNLGIDNLLLRASELNAQNFTKAFGQKVDSEIILNEQESPDFVLTIPKSNENTWDLTLSHGRNENETKKDNEVSKTPILQSIRLDVYESFCKQQRKKEIKEQSSISASEKPKPRLKVRSVQSINGDFEPNLNFKKKKIESSTDKESVEKQRNATQGESSCLNDGKFNLNNENEFPKFVAWKKLNESEKNSLSIAPAKRETIKQKPTILRNSSHCKKKKTNLEKFQKNKSKLKAKEVHTSIGTVPLQKVSNDSYNNSASSEKDTCNEISHNTALKELSSESCLGSTNKNIKDTETSTNTKIKNYLGGNVVPPSLLNFNKKSKSVGLLPRINLKALGKENEESSSKIETKEKASNLNLPVEANSLESTFVGTSNRTSLDTSKKTEIGNIVESQNFEENHLSKSMEKNLCKEVPGPIISLTAFTDILKELLLDEWILRLDKKYGLQIMKMCLNECLNPCISVSVVISKSGDVVVNVQGKALEKSHKLFSNICSISNSVNKLRLNYVLSIINKLNHLNVCIGCDPSLQNHLANDALVSNSMKKQTRRSYLCHLLVSTEKTQCFPCYHLSESLKKHYNVSNEKKRTEEKHEEHSKKNCQETEEKKAEEPEGEKSNQTCSTSTTNTVSIEAVVKNNVESKKVKKNLGDFLEKSFSTMKQQIENEIEKNKQIGEREKYLKAQEEAMSLMGLIRKENLTNSVRKSKRKKKSSYKTTQSANKKVEQKDLEFLEKYWIDINKLFSTSLLFGAYSRTGTVRLRENCKMFHELLSTWRYIAQSNPEWIGEEVFLPNSRGVEQIFSQPCKKFDVTQFEKMDVSGLRTYIMNAVKEVNRIKHKLRTRNSYFKLLYNKFVKRRMKRTKSFTSNVKKKRGGNAGNKVSAYKCCTANESKEKTKQENPEVSDNAVTRS